MVSFSNLRLGFFGGSFDPPHRGHLRIAEIALEQANLDKLLFCPAYHAPLRPTPPFFTSHDRLAMVDILSQSHPNMEVYAGEIEHGKTRYTIETIQEVKKQFPKHELFLILGADQFSHLLDWREPHLLAQMVHFLVFARLHKKIEKPAIPELRFTFMENPLINISSTNIRASLNKKHLPSSMLPPDIYTFIRDKNLCSIN